MQENYRLARFSTQVSFLEYEILSRHDGMNDYMFDRMTTSCMAS